jgi:hypothetical protein
MTTLTYSKRDLDYVMQWIAARDEERKSAKFYHGDRPCLPAAAMLAVAQRIWRKRRP